MLTFFQHLAPGIVDGVAGLNSRVMVSFLPGQSRDAQSIGPLGSSIELLHTAFGSALTLLLTLVGFKYQGSATTLFREHSLLISLFIVDVLVYVVAVVNEVIRATSNTSTTSSCRDSNTGPILYYWGQEVFAVYPLFTRGIRDEQDQDVGNNLFNSALSEGSWFLRIYNGVVSFSSIGRSMEHQAGGDVQISLVCLLARPLRENRRIMSLFIMTVNLYAMALVKMILATSNDNHQSSNSYPAVFLIARTFAFELLLFILLTPFGCFLPNILALVFLAVHYGCHQAGADRTTTELVPKSEPFLTCLLRLQQPPDQVQIVMMSRYKQS
ncbi:hypothetical protein TIFTF001_019598 [Ficus carica]|uniref:Transmembrane protein n=1 Tax=Ficus carica TaxID=3494 RepID=A0AA88AGP5_FICCA|nr:hypothetical protein TIFTF001_019598 [Ficus carica]